MPEGDSVHRLARRLDAATAGRAVVSGDIRWPSIAGADLTGTRLERWRAHGKHLLADLDDGRTLHSHLGMDGGWSVLRPQRQLPRRLQPLLRIALRIDDGRTLCGIDLKALDIVPTHRLDDLIGHLGPDVLDPGFDADRAAQRFAGAAERRIGEALLDQRGVAGLGNLWVVESLFLRGVHPDRPVREVDVAALLHLAQRMMRHSLEHGTGQTTTGVRRRGETHWVYGRAGRPCRRCGTSIRFRSGDRSAVDRETWWCPHCQPAPAPDRTDAPAVTRPAPSAPAAGRSAATPPLS